MRNALVRALLYILTSKCVSRHNGVHFFDIATSKSGPNVVCFVHFDFEMGFAPQRRALFSTSQLPKVVRTSCALYILTSKCASRHNGVQLFISHLARWLRTSRFSEPTFQPPGAKNHWKNTVFRDFPTFSRICSFFILTLSLLWSSLFYSSLLADSSHLCFSSVHIVGSLTSKLPSIIIYIYIYIHAPQRWFEIYKQFSLNERLLYLPASDTARQLQKCQARSATCLRKPIEGILGQLGHGISRGKTKRCCQNWHCWAMEKRKGIAKHGSKFW